MRRLSYGTRTRAVRYIVLPVLFIVPFMIAGYHATHAIFAQPVTPIQGLHITTSTRKYHVGQIVTIIMTNDSSTNVFVNNNCPNEPLAVYRREANSWVRIHASTTLANCKGALTSYELPAHRSIVTDYRYWKTLFAQPGEYGIVLTPEFSSVSVATDFTVTQ